MAKWMRKLQIIWQESVSLYVSQVDSSGLYCLSHTEFLQCRRLGFHPWLEMTPWKRIWLLTPVLLPGEIHGQRSLVNYNPWATIQRVRHD